MKYLTNTPAVGLAATVALGISAGLMTGSVALAQSGSGDAAPGFATESMAAKIGTDLAALYERQTAFAPRIASRVATGGITRDDSLMQIVGDKVVIDAVTAGDSEILLSDLTALGMQNGSAYGHVVSGMMPISALADVAALGSLRFARPAMATAQVGLVTSQGDAAMHADEARDEEEVSGRGVTVGVMSDSYDCLGGAAADIASEDLPPASRITILAEGPCFLGLADEGRGMMQLVRDVAPDAGQAFHTAFGGQADFANGILELANDAGADIVVDDVFYFAEPMFQDGIIAQAADTVKAQGVPYFSSAGNGGRNSWESGDRGFVSSGVIGSRGLRHDFDPGPGVDDLQSIVIAPGVTRFSLQWDEPFASVSGAPGSASDLDIILYIPGLGDIGIRGIEMNIGNDPVEVFGVRNNASAPAILEIGIELRGGPPPRFMKYVIFDPSGPEITDPATSFPVDFPTDSSTNYGHSNAEGAAGVAAAFWRNTPAFGVSPPVPEVFTSAGGTPILFDTAGNRIAAVVRDQPRFTGPDGGVTTFFGGRDSFGTRAPGGNHFFGTSASAPHVAAVAALMLEANPALTPDAIYEILEDTAIDMDDPFTPGFDNGFDLLTGHGFVDAEEAVDEAEDYEDDNDDDEDEGDDDDGGSVASNG